MECVQEWPCPTYTSHIHISTCSVWRITHRLRVHLFLHQCRYILTDSVNLLTNTPHLGISMCVWLVDIGHSRSLTCLIPTLSHNFFTSSSRDPYILFNFFETCWMFWSILNFIDIHMYVGVPTLSHNFFTSSSRDPYILFNFFETCWMFFKFHMYVGVAC